jgi:hypothetical protein
MAFTGQGGMQSPQPVQAPMLICAVVIPLTVCLKEIAPCSHYSSHVRQVMPFAGRQAPVIFIANPRLEWDSSLTFCGCVRNESLKRPFVK